MATLINIKNPNLGDVWLRDIDSLMLGITFTAAKFIKESNGDYTVVGIPEKIVGEIEWCVWDKGFAKADKPSPYPAITFPIHRNSYQGKNKEKQTVTIEPTPLELFFCDVLDKTTEQGKQYKGELHYSPMDSDSIEKRSIFDESNPDFLRSQIMREMCIKFEEIEPNEGLNGLEPIKKSGGSKSFSSKNEGEKLKERNDFIVAAIKTLAPLDYNPEKLNALKFANVGSLIEFSASDDGEINEGLLSQATELRDYLITLIG